VSETALGSKRAFDFLRMNEREGKPRSRGVTEIRGTYYSAMAKRYLSDVLETMGEYVDPPKFIIETAHEHDFMVSTGGFIEYVLIQGPDAVDEYVRACREVGFGIIEISGGFISIATDDWLRLVERVQNAGLKAKPDVGIQFGAGGDTEAGELQVEGTRDPEWMISRPGASSTRGLT
jgi:phosphosulfolactate synthase (CoM biosynthesis protein A)